MTRLCLPLLAVVALFNTAEARTVRIKTRVETVHVHVHRHEHVHSYAPAPSVEVVRPLTGGEKRRLKRNGAIVIR